MPRTKVIDELYEYQGLSRLMSHCRVRIYTADGMVPVVAASECADNPGTSVTNAATVLYPGLIARYLPGWLEQADNLVLLEHYPEHETFDQVTFAHWRPAIIFRHGLKHVAFGKASWRHVRRDRVIELVGEEILIEERVE